MNFLREWVISICYCAVVSTISYMILPKSGVTKVFKITLSVFLLICIISPIKNMRFIKNYSIDIDVDEETNEISEKISEINENYVYDIASYNIHVLIEDNLKNEGINPKDIEVIVFKNENTSELDIKANIILDKQYENKKTSIDKIVKQDLKINADISYVDERTDKDAT